MRIFSADVDGDYEIIATSTGGIDITGPDTYTLPSGNHEIAWWENNGTPGSGNSWTKHDVSGFKQFPAANTIYAADIDKDGDIDIIAGAEHDKEIAVLENNMVK